MLILLFCFMISGYFWIYINCNFSSASPYEQSFNYYLKIASNSRICHVKCKKCKLSNFWKFLQKLSHSRNTTHALPLKIWHYHIVGHQHNLYPVLALVDIYQNILNMRFCLKHDHAYFYLDYSLMLCASHETNKKILRIVGYTARACDDCGVWKWVWEKVTLVYFYFDIKNKMLRSKNWQLHENSIFYNSRELFEASVKN